MRNKNKRFDFAKNKPGSTVFFDVKELNVHKNRVITAKE